jgi:hypothetical protein
MKKLWGHSPLEFALAVIAFTLVSGICVGVVFVFLYMDAAGSVSLRDTTSRDDQIMLWAVGIEALLVVGWFWYRIFTKPFP